MARVSSIEDLVGPLGLDGRPNQTSFSARVMISEAPKTFILFKRMPAEVQLEVIKIAIADSDPRVVEVRFSESPISNKFDIVADIPALLHVNSMAREEAKKVYTLTLSTKHGTKQVYMNFQKDTIFFRLNNGCRQVYSVVEQLVDKDKIQHVAVKDRIFVRPLWYENINQAHWVLQFPNLKSIKVVGSRSTPYGYYHQREDCKCLENAPDDRSFFMTKEQGIYHRSGHENPSAQDAFGGYFYDQREFYEEWFLASLQSRSWGKQSNWKQLPEFLYAEVLYDKISNGAFYFRAEGWKRRQEKRKARASKMALSASASNATKLKISASFVNGTYGNSEE